MADHAVEDDDGDIVIYRGGRVPFIYRGRQYVHVPQHVTHVLIDRSVSDIEENAFEYCENLVQVDTHEGIRRVGKWAFCGCKSLRRINLKSVVEIDKEAFFECKNLESVKFGDRLQTIGEEAFAYCTSLKHLKLPSIITIERRAFDCCTHLTDIEFSEFLETIEVGAFWNCERLQRIAVPLNRDLFEFDYIEQEDQIEFDDFDRDYTQFANCEQLTTVHLVGAEGIQKTVASLHMESWRTEILAEINRINQVLPNTPAHAKTNEIKRWMDADPYSYKLSRYKRLHKRYVKEGITLLELALWKAKLSEKRERRPKRAKFDAESYRRNKRVTCGADIVIKNVLPFLQLE